MIRRGKKVVCDKTCIGLVFVMDGSAPQLKAKTLQIRKESQSQGGGSRGSQSSQQHGGGSQSTNLSRSRLKGLMNECGRLLECLGISYVRAGIVNNACLSRWLISIGKNIRLFERVCGIEVATSDQIKCSILILVTNPKRFRDWSVFRGKRSTYSGLLLTASP